ncbi:ATP-grasp domain-containing protein [Evansella halocellulosilytica]|uniref:ATP-grasp domain-containing protein n=1 Tax=Evansella halocellulosilytica TaxID=2011013 RepID=UPI000BB96237|nr:ATP-grasp domain-containing protein [Evansella halocellulosilytica]
MEDKPYWPSHLTNNVVSQADGHELCAYLVALEGWRRGLELKWYSGEFEKFNKMKTWYVDRPGKLFSLSTSSRTHYFFRTRSDIITNEAVEIGSDKDNTKKVLSKLGVPVPNGKRFNSSYSDEQIVDESLEIGFPLVVKPVDGSFGRGVITNIINKESLKKAVKYIRNELKYNDVIVEEYIAGEEYRVYVVGDEVVAAMHRIPANIIGNGIDTIKELIEKKNQNRRENPRLISCPIKVNKELEEFIQASGYRLSSILQEGKQLFLTNKSNISLGGDPIDVTDTISDKAKEIAIDAVKAVPGLFYGGVDIIINDRTSNNETVAVIELNPTAQIGSLLYPSQGKGRDVPAAIIDYLFPESVSDSKEKSTLYFDFQDVLSPLENKANLMTKVSRIQEGKTYGKKYTIYGDIDDVYYLRQLKNEALSRNLHGFVNKIEPQKIEVIIAGEDIKKILTYKDVLNWNNNGDFTISEQNWDKPVKMGFEIQNEPDKLIDELKTLRTNRDSLSKKKRNAEKQYKLYRESTSWKISKPLRAIYNIVKRILK